MAPSAPLQAVKFVLLLPERLPEAALPVPIYAKVTRRTRSGVMVREQGDDQRKWKISEDQAQAWAVSTAEVESTPTPLLRAPVVLTLADRIVHGQVVAHNGHDVLVATAEGEHRVAPAEVTVTAPVPAILLRSLTFEADDWSTADVIDVHQEVLNRILGTNGASATREINAILHGLINDDMFPTGTEVIKWVNPSSGVVVEFPVQHAVDFAFYKDGGVQPIPDSVGDSFCTPPPPTRRPQLAGRRMRRITAAAAAPPPRGANTTAVSNAMFDEQVDDDEIFVEDDNVQNEPVAPSATRLQQENDQVPPPAKRQRMTNSNGQHQRSGEILAALAAHPQAQCAFAEDYLPSSSKATRPAAALTSSQTDPISSLAGMLARATDEMNTGGQTLFTPSLPQTQVSDQVSAAHHRGTTMEDYVDGMISSQFCLFKPLPGVVTRVRDIQFGKRGLSVMHFLPLSFEDKVAWYNSGRCNYKNLGSATPVPKAHQPTDVHEILVACQTLELFASDYFSSDLRVAISALVSVVKHVAQAYTWCAEDLPLLTYWINVTLEEYRTHVSQGSLVPGQFSAKFSIENISLQHILQLVCSKQLQRLRDRVTQSDAAPRQHHAPPNNSGRTVLVTNELEKLIPLEGTKQLCLRCLSVKGCRSTEEMPCFSGRAHFEPESLHPRLKALIKKKFGGLKPKYKSL